MDKQHKTGNITETSQTTPDDVKTATNDRIDPDNITTRRARDSGFRSCSECDSPSYLSATKLRLSRQISANPRLTLKHNNSQSKDTEDEVFSDSEICDVFFAVSSFDEDVVQSRRPTTARTRGTTLSLPSDHMTDHVINSTCDNSQCHCPACCVCENKAKKPPPRSNCQSLTLNDDKSDSYFNDSSFTNSILPSPSSPTMISSWAHYHQRSDWHYKYARSDYSSDSDEEFTFTRLKSKHKITKTTDPSGGVGVASAAAFKPKQKIRHSQKMGHQLETTTSVTAAKSNHSQARKQSSDNDTHDNVSYSHTVMKQTTSETDRDTNISNQFNSPLLSPKIVLHPATRLSEPKQTVIVDDSWPKRDNSESKVCDKHPSVVKPHVDPQQFKDYCQSMTSWYSDLNDEHRNIVLRHLLGLSSLPQIHLLSVHLQDRLHHGCPRNCEDIVTWIPFNLATKVFTFLDPVSLCHASLVCRIWYDISSNESLWRRFCCQAKWRLSKPAEHKQVVRHMSPLGSIQWKRVFAERYRLRRNWLIGRCSVRTFEGHTQGISCVQFDDTRIVSGSSDKTIKVWNIRTNAPWSVQTLVGHSGTVRCLHLEGNKLVSGSTDRSIKVWDLSTQDSWSSIACKVTMVGHSDTVRCLQVDDEKVISGSYDKTLKIWDIRTGECMNTLRGHQAAVLCVYSSDTKIVSGSCDKTIKVWENSRCLMTLQGHQDAVTCLQFDSTRIISGSLDCTLKFWDINTGQCVNTIDWRDSEGHTGVVRCLQADAWRLVSAADDKTLKVWNLETGERLVTLKNHTDGVTCMQFNDFVIVSGSYDKTVKLWDFSCC